MLFQSTVNTALGLGKPGTIARLNPLTRIPVVAEGANVVAGGFVFEGTNPELQVVGASASTSGATEVAGVCVFEKFQPGLSLVDTLTLNEGEECAKVLKGYVYVMCTTASVHGQKVAVNPTTGEIQTFEASASAPASFIDTGWMVETGNAANQPCEIYKL